VNDERQDDEMLTRADAARALKVSPRTLDRMREDGLPWVRGKRHRVLIPRSAIDAALRPRS